ncbi:RNA-directed DNA polymerase, eukaryota, partial [Tanacetum coccineum]
MEARFRSNVDHTQSIFKSIFVTNFPDKTTSKDLWEVCQGYGTVVDVYIPNRKSKAGKRFAFVRFIRVDNIDRLVGNLCTLWIGRMHLHANVVRFERSRPTNPIKPDVTGVSSFASVLKGNANNLFPTTSLPAMVLDDECVVKHNLDNFVMGEVKDFSSINNLRVLLSNEGFQKVKLAYLGGLWVMIELASIKSKKSFMKHVGIASWFNHLCDAQSDFVSRERIVWVDIEGVPLHAWSRSAFLKIGARWGKTKELFVWSSMFKDSTEAAFCSDDESLKEDDEISVDSNNHVDSDAESDVEGVSDTVFGDQDDKPGKEQAPIQSPKDKELSSDPFNLYNLLNKQDKGETNSGLGSSIPFPPGFTPERINTRNDAQEDIVSDHDKSKCRSDGFSSRIVEDAQPLNEHLSSDSPDVGHGYKKGGSILEVLDDMIKLWQTMGFSMEGCLGSKAKKDWIKELNVKHKLNFLSIQETKMDGISDMTVQTVMDGNYNRWNGECMVMGDFNKVRCLEERMGSVFNVQGANAFNNFISNSGLVEIQLKGFLFRWSHPLATKMSKLDRFLVSEGLVSLFPHLSGICLDRHLSDHRPILLREVVSDYGPTPFRVFHSWFSLQGFDQMVIQTWNDIDLDDNNGMVRFKKKLQILKKGDSILGTCSQAESVESSHGSSIQTSRPPMAVIEGDENSKFFHGIINGKRANLAIKGVMVDSEWVDEPCRVKEEFRSSLSWSVQLPRKKSEKRCGVVE